DLTVTGVQTCALPISVGYGQAPPLAREMSSAEPAQPAVRRLLRSRASVGPSQQTRGIGPAMRYATSRRKNSTRLCAQPYLPVSRSEERRVGKEYRIM